MRWVFAYDVSQDDRRARLAAAISAWGNRVQRSVFECSISSDELEGLLTQAHTIIDTETDSLRAYRQWAACDDMTRALGQAPVRSETPYWII